MGNKAGMNGFGARFTGDVKKLRDLFKRHL